MGAWLLKTRVRLRFRAGKVHMLSFRAAGHRSMITEQRRWPQRRALAPGESHFHCHTQGKVVLCPICASSPSPGTPGDICTPQDPTLQSASPIPKPPVSLQACCTRDSSPDIFSGPSGAVCPPRGHTPAWPSEGQVQALKAEKRKT